MTPVPADPLTVTCPVCEAALGVRCLDARLQPTTPHAQRLRKAKRDKGRVSRGYSKAFRPHGDSGKRYLLDDIPAGLWKDVKAKSKRTGVSIRAKLLQRLAEWVAEAE